MAKSEYVLNIGDDNVVLTRFVDGKVANAWLGSPDPAMAQEELGEALAEDTKGRISVIVDTLDQSYKEEEVPKVGILDRRKVLARHITMAFPGSNMRGARLVKETDKKTLIYEFASIPLDGRIPGWLDFIASLPNEKGGFHALAAENVDMIQALAPKDAIATEDGQNHWRHFIGINVTGGLRQIIEKNGRLSLTRLTQAPPADTPPEEFGDMILRDFKATITYIRRLGYQVGEALDLIVLTTAQNKRVLEELDWQGARSVSVYTPYEAGALLGLGSLGKEDQAYCDVLHAAWFASKRKSSLPLTKAVALGDTKDDIRELSYVAAPYVAGLALASLIGWAGWMAYQVNEMQATNQPLAAELARLSSTLTQAQTRLSGMPYEPARVRNVIEVADALDLNKVDLVPALQHISNALQSDALITEWSFSNIANDPIANRAAAAKAAARGAPAGEKISYAIDLDMRLAEVISTAEEAVQTARRLEKRLTDNFGSGFKVTMTTEPVGAQAAAELKGTFSDAGSETSSASGTLRHDAFRAAYRIEKVAK